MEYAHLGRTGLSVSRFCLGTMAFGREADEPTSVRIMDRALELGINFFDTANVYWTAARRHRRDRGSLAGAGRRSPRENRAGDQGLWRGGRGSE